MGQTSSTSTPSSLPNYALHCLRVAEGSPADGIIEEFFDYLIGIQAPNTPASSSALGESGVALEEDGVSDAPSPSDLTRVIAANEGNRLLLSVYNAKTQRIREVSIIPSRAWNEDSKDNSKPSLLGLSMRICNPAQALESVWHILEVLEGSPAEMAGLVPFGDWVCGWAGGPLHSENSFYDLVEAHIDKPLRLYVYSADLDNLREVVVIPNEKWGGSGLLGCGVGYGILHRIPRPVTPPSDQGADGYFLPASLQVHAGTGLKVASSFSSSPITPT